MSEEKMDINRELDQSELDRVTGGMSFHDLENYKRELEELIKQAENDGDSEKAELYKKAKSRTEKLMRDALEFDY